jgi:hypothetical protein
MNLVDRAKNIIMTPKTEWEVIDKETTSTAELYKGYIVLLALIGPVATALRSMVSYFSIYGLVSAITMYVFMLIGVFLMALLVNALAPSFGGQKSQIQALKVTAYSMTPGMIAGVLHLLPMLSILVLLAAIYGLYLLYLGLPVLMKVTQEKAVAYTATIVVCGLVIGIVLGAILHSIGGYGWMMGYPSYSYMGGSNSNANIEALDQMRINAEAARKQMEVARQSGNPQAQANAAVNAMGALASANGTGIEPIDQNMLKALLPDTVGNLKRTKLEAEKTAVANFKMSKADAGYAGDAGQSVDLSITDAGGTPMFAGLTAWAMIEQEKETSDGYEKMGKVDGRPVHEKFNKNSKDGEYSVVIAGRFIIDAHGRQVDMDTLKQAVAAIGPDKLEAMKSVGIK